MKNHHSQSARTHTSTASVLVHHGQTLNCCENWQNKNVQQQNRERERAEQTGTAELLMRGVSWRRLWQLAFAKRNLHRHKIFKIEPPPRREEWAKRQLANKISRHHRPKSTWQVGNPAACYRNAMQHGHNNNGAWRQIFMLPPTPPPPMGATG